ncbi:hypothetical protein [Bacillus thuringiensis]|uniref:hypothetical protein n=1 Tax=Bacillus thuringiensis TaxID=1428 RepID=UPI003B981ACD
MKENTYQKIVLRANSEEKSIQIKQEYFKIQSINELKMTYDEYINIEKLVNKCIDSSLRKQYLTMGKELVSKEKTYSDDLAAECTMHVINHMKLRDHQVALVLIFSPQSKFIRLWRKTS